MAREGYRLWFGKCNDFNLHGACSRVLDVWLPFCDAGRFESYGGGILVVVEGDAAIPGVFGTTMRCISGRLPMLLLAEAGRRCGGAYHRAEAFEGGVQPRGA